MENERIIYEYEQLNSIDKEICRLETEMINYFFDNIDKDYVSGKIDCPLVASGIISDYEKLRLEKRNIELEIKIIEKQMDNIQSYIPNIVYELEKDNLSDDQIKQETEKRIMQQKNDFEIRISKLNGILKMIDEDPKTYLRFKEFQDGDYSKIKCKEVRKKLKDMRKKLKGLKCERKRILKYLKSYLHEYEHERVSRKIYS